MSSPPSSAASSFSPSSSPQFVFEPPPSPGKEKQTSTPLSLFLEKLDAIPSSTIPTGFIRNTKLMNSLYSKKQQQIDVIVNDFASTGGAVPYNWISLFYQRMVACENTISITQSEHYKNVLDFYLQFKILNNENRVAVKSLLTYLETHTADPDNSLIGLTPSKSIIESLNHSNDEASKDEPNGTLTKSLSFASNFTTQELIEMILSWDEMSDDDAAICIHQFAASARNHNNGGPMGLSLTPTLPRATSSPSLLRTSSHGSLPSSYSQSPPSSPSRTPSSFSLFPGLFKKSMENKIETKLSALTPPPWKEGDIVVVFVGMCTDPGNKEFLAATIKKAIEDMDENAFMFARVNDPCIDAEQSVGVFIDRHEQKTRVVSRESVFKYKFTQASPSMVYDISQKFFAKLTAKLADKTNQFLVSQGIDMQTLELALEGDATFFDIPAINKNIGIIHSLLLLDSINWTNFLGTVREYSEKKVKSFLVDIESEGKVFTLSRKQIQVQLNNFDYASISSARLQSYLSVCQTALETLKTLQEKILAGTAKNELSEWYLEHIKECVDSFLERNGVSLDVIPDNYIDQAPKDLALVNKTWAMVRELLDIIVSYNAMKTDTKHEVIDVMTTLMDDIYTRLDEFVLQSLFVIAEKLGVTKTRFEVSDNQDVYDECCKLFAGVKETLTPDESEKLDEVLKDVEYILKIREMEGIQQEQKSLDHVPISGLIASRFFRLENELRTSLEVWEPSRQEELNPTATEPSPPAPAELKNPAVESIVEGSQPNGFPSSPKVAIVQ